MLGKPWLTARHHSLLISTHTPGRATPTTPSLQGLSEVAKKTGTTTITTTAAGNSSCCFAEALDSPLAGHVQVHVLSLVVLHDGGCNPNGMNNGAEVVRRKGPVWVSLTMHPATPRQLLRPVSQAPPLHSPHAPRRTRCSRNVHRAAPTMSRRPSCGMHSTQAVLVCVSSQPVRRVRLPFGCLVVRRAIQLLVAQKACHTYQIVYNSSRGRCRADCLCACLFLILSDKRRRTPDVCHIEELNES